MPRTAFPRRTTSSEDQKQRTPAYIEPCGWQSSGFEVGDAVLVLDEDLAVNEGSLAGELGAGLGDWCGSKLIEPHVSVATETRDVSHIRHIAPN
jgi:hypothetical protein